MEPTATAETRSPIHITRQSAADTARVFSSNMYRNAYARGMTLTQLLENMDPTHEREDADQGIDAFERVLQAAEIVTQPVHRLGIRASTWEEATDTAQKRALMPELFSRVWKRAGRLSEPDRLAIAGKKKPSSEARAVLLSSDYTLNTIANPYSDDLTLRAQRLVPPIPLERIVARTTMVDGDALRSIFIADALGTDAYRMKRVAEAAIIPTTTLITGERTIRLLKYGRALKTSYEQLRRMRIDRIAFVFARMALQAEVDKVSMVLNTVVNGDGNANTAATVIALTTLDSAATPPNPTLKAWLTFKLRFPLTYQPDVLLAQEGPMVSLLLMPLSAANTMPLGYISGMTPFGSLSPINDQWAFPISWGITADAPASKWVGWQVSGGVERVVEVGGDVAEVEQFASDQTRLMTVTEVEGYGVIDPSGAKIANLAA